MLLKSSKKKGCCHATLWWGFPLQAVDKNLPFGLVPQALQAAAGQASPHQDVVGGYTGDRDRK